MYLSQLILNPRNRRVQKEVVDPYQMHRSLMRAFPDDLEAGAERVLFWVEGERLARGLTVLVQSLNLPDWSWLAQPGARGYLLPVDEPNPWVKSVELKLARDQVLAFRLRANPTVKRKGKRLGLYRQEEQRLWLARKGEQGGFHIVSVRIANQQVLGGEIHRDGDTHQLRLLSVQFEGMLEVTDPERLAETVRHGVGSAKALGLGLLSLARPRS